MTTQHSNANWTNEDWQKPWPVDCKQCDAIRSWSKQESVAAVAENTIYSQHYLFHVQDNHTTDQRDTERVLAEDLAIEMTNVSLPKRIEIADKYFASHRKQLAAELLEALPIKRKAVLSADGPQVADAYMNGFNTAREIVEQLIKEKLGV